MLRGWSAGLGWTEWGSYPLLPWSNRIPGGHLDLGGAHADLATNWPDGSAIHGLAATRPWQVVTRTDGTATLSLDIDVAPWCLTATQHFTLTAGQLDEEVIVENVGGDTVPIGLGIHPWFRAGLLLVPADMKWPGDPLPVGPPIPVEYHDDLRRGMVPPVMDRCFTGLTGSHVDVPGVRLRWEGPITHVVVYTGEPGWAAVEPVTMANDGFGLAARGIAGHGVILIDPGTKVRVAYSFTALPEERSSG